VNRVQETCGLYKVYIDMQNGSPEGENIESAERIVEKIMPG
jgi:hypothetical protein